MPRKPTSLTATLAISLSLELPLLAGLTTVVGIGAELASTQAAYAQNAEDWFNSGVAKADRGDYQGAIFDYTRAIKMYPQYGSAYYNRGNAKSKLKDYKGSITDYTNAIRYQPNFYQAFTNRGISLEMVGDLKGACNDWKRAIALGDTLPGKWVKRQC